MAQIESLIFFDIETTGLPYQEKNRTKIIELSFVAVSRREIEVTDIADIPAVSKLTLVFNPQKRIHPEVVAMTGLSNELLRFAPTFGRKVKTLVSFIQELPKPVCLVAHNGNSFDYKILLAECKDANTSLPPDLLCVDSLIGFRKLLKGTSICHESLLLEISQNTTTSSAGTACDDLLTDDEDEWPVLNLSGEEWQEIEEIELCQQLSDSTISDTDENSANYVQIQKNRREAIKNVFNKTGNNKKEVDKTKSKVKESFKLTDLYKRLLNKEELNAHRAEADCMMLVHCVVALKQQFLPWADSSCKLLTHIKPLVRT